MSEVESLGKLDSMVCGFAEGGLHADIAGPILEGIDAAIAEVAERFVRLPVDCDGIPWRPGEYLGGGERVDCLILGPNGWELGICGDLFEPEIFNHFSGDPEICGEAERDRLASLLEEFAHRCGADTARARTAALEYADAILEGAGR